MPQSPVKYNGNDEVLKKILDQVIAWSESPEWQVEIARLPSGRVGYIFMAVEDAVSDYGVLGAIEDGDNLILTFDSYDGEPLPEKAFNRKVDGGF